MTQSCREGKHRTVRQRRPSSRYQPMHVRRELDGCCAQIGRDQREPEVGDPARQLWFPPVVPQVEPGQALQAASTPRGHEAREAVDVVVGKEEELKAGKTCRVSTEAT